MNTRKDCDISKYFGYFAKTATQVALSASVLSGCQTLRVHLLQKAMKKLQKQMNSLCTRPRLLDNSCKGVLLKFCSSTSEWTVEALESCEELDELPLQASQQYAG